MAKNFKKSVSFNMAVTSKEEIRLLDKLCAGDEMLHTIRYFIGDGVELFNAWLIRNSIPIRAIEGKDVYVIGLN
jgi:hypothetical protein